MDLSQFIVGVFERCEFKEDGCIIWTGVMNSKPFYKRVNVQKFIWELFNEEVYKLENTCDNEKCINIDHFEGFDKFESTERILQKGTTIDPETGCHNWSKSCDSRGYGRIIYDGVEIRCTLFSYMVKHNIRERNLIPKKLIMRHNCPKKNSSCHNPDHIEIGTNQDNSNDMIRDGTVLTGEQNPNCKITVEIATKIKHSLYPKEHDKYKTQKERALIFGVKVNIIRAIDNGKAWFHIPNREGEISTTKAESMRKRKREKRKKDKERIFTMEDYEKIRETLKLKSKLSIENNQGDVEGDCWESLNKPDNNGYCSVGILGVETKAHQFAAMVSSKRKVLNGEKVRHLCHNKICCNPDHVEIGTDSDNMQDGLRLGTSKRFKLNYNKVKEIRASKKTNSELSEEYNVHIATINNILSYRSWNNGKNIKVPDKRLKLNEDKVREIRESTKTKTELSKEYKVCKTTITNIINKSDWKDVK